MSFSLFVIIVSATTLLISFMWMYKLLGKNMILSLPGFFYIYFIVFIFLGSPFIFIINGLDNYLYIISTHLVLIILPMSIYLVNTLMFADYPQELNSYLEASIIDKQPGNQFSIVYFILLGVSIVITMIYFFKLDIIPINYLLTNVSDKLDASELAKLREASTTTFKYGKLHRYRFFMAEMVPFLVIISFIKYKLSKTNFWRIQFYLLTIFAIYRSIADLQKAPLVQFIILLFLTAWVYGGKIKWKQVGILFSIVLTLLSLMYIYIMGVNQGFVRVLERIGSRMFLTHSNALHHYFSLFPSMHDFLYGVSLPNPAGIFQFEHFPVTKWVFINGMNRNWEIVGTAPSAFIGEIYANFGFSVMLLSIFVLSILLQIMQIKFTSKPRTLLYTAFYIYFVFLAAKFALTGLFIVFHIYLFIFLFAIIIIVDGYKVLTTAIK